MQTKISKKQMVKGRVYKRNAIISAASELFLTKGYGVTNMDEIAKKADVSKQTIYSHFQNKEVLLKEVVESICANSPCILDDVESLPKNIKDAMFRVADDYMKSFLHPRSVCLMRLIQKESLNIPEIRKTFMSSCMDKAYRRLTAFFTSLSNTEKMHMSDPQLAAKMFMGSLSGPFSLRVMSGESIRFEDVEVQEQIDYTVRSFIFIHKS